ncbi:hypothetical protein GCM10009737_00170 [Nocardioides lentus]|uniref:Uncharacterized protein n=1 Tax=Nocardioides lentus TaxID=338077 RepID=A0ABN2NVD8_9ACTN
MVTYVVRLEWPADRTPALRADALTARLAAHEPSVEHEPRLGPGPVVVDGDERPWSITVCAEGTTPRLAAMNALGVVEPVIGARVSRFEVLSSAECEQVAEDLDAVPELISDESVAHLVGDTHGPLAELLTRPDFPPVVVETRLGPLRDLREVQAWLRDRGGARGPDPRASGGGGHRTA